MSPPRPLATRPHGWPDLLGRLALLAAFLVGPFLRRSQVPGARPDEIQFKWLTVILALAAVAVALLGLARRMRRPPSGALLVLMFGAWTLATCLWSRDPLFSLRDWTLLGSGLIVYALVVTSRLPTQRLLQPLLWAVLITAAINALFADLHFAFEKGPLARTSLGQGLAEALGYTGGVLEGKRNVRALFAHPNFLSIFLVMSLAFAVAALAAPHRRLRPLPLLILATGGVLCWFIPGMKPDDSLRAVIGDWRLAALLAAAGGSIALALIAWRFPRLQRPILCLVLLGALAGVVVCRSRSGWLALALVMMITALAGWRHRRVRLWHLLALAALLGGAALGVNHLRQTREAQATWQEVATFNTATARMYNFQLAARMVLERPLLGWGHGSFKIEYYHSMANPRLRPEDPALYEIHLKETRGRPPVHVHNDYFELALETGVVGLGLFLLLICWTGVRLLEIALAPPAREITWQAVALGAGLVAMLSDMMLSFPLNLPFSGALFWLMIGMAHRLSQDWQASAQA